MSDFKKIVIRGTNWLGDSVITIPSVKALKRLYPSASLGIIAPANLAGLWENEGAVDHVLPVARPTGIREKLRLIKLIRAGRYDLGVIFPNSFESALWCFLSGVRRRLGYATCGRGLLLNRKVRPLNDGGHQVRRYLNLVRALGPIHSEPAPSIAVPDGLRQWAHDALRAKGIVENDRLVGINPGSTYGPAKCWPPDKFAGLIRLLRERLGVSVVIVGGKRERALADALCRGIGKGVVNMACETTVMQLAALLERCAVVVSNDTGPMHLTGVIGPTDPVATGPLGTHLLIRSEVECSPCLKRRCPTDHRCMTSISVDRVYEAVVNLLKQD